MRTSTRAGRRIFTTWLRRLGFDFLTDWSRRTNLLIDRRHSSASWLLRLMRIRRRSEWEVRNREATARQPVRRKVVGARGGVATVEYSEVMLTWWMSRTSTLQFKGWWRMFTSACRGGWWSFRIVRRRIGM